MQKDKKMAAAIAAVIATIKSEEEMAAAGMGVVASPPQVTYRHSGLWGMSGRQSQMQLRHLMQLKTFQGSRLR